MSDYVRIPLSKTGKRYKGLYEAIVDIEDGDLAGFNWTASIRKSSKVYATRNANHSQMHRIILERMLKRQLVTNEEVDHIDGDCLNNRRENLRLATHSQNQKNRRRNENNLSGYKGVQAHGKGWKARITSNGRNIYLGVFYTPEEAHDAYCEAAKELHGEFYNPG